MSSPDGNRVFAFVGAALWLNRPGLFYLWPQAGKTGSQVQRGCVNGVSVLRPKHLLAGRVWSGIVGAAVFIAGVRV